MIQEGLTLDSVELLTFLCGGCRDEVRDARGTICLLSLCLGARVQAIIIKFRAKKNPPIFKLNLLVCTVYVKKLFSGSTAKIIIDINIVGFGYKYFRNYIEIADYTLAFLQETRRSMNKNVSNKMSCKKMDRTFYVYLNLLNMHLF